MIYRKGSTTLCHITDSLKSETKPKAAANENYTTASIKLGDP